MKYIVFVLWWNDSTISKCFTNITEALDYINWVENLPNYRYHKLLVEGGY